MGMGVAVGAGAMAVAVAAWVGEVQETSAQAATTHKAACLSRGQMLLVRRVLP